MKKKKNNFIKFSESKNLPVNFFFLEKKEKDTSSILNVSFSKKNNGIMLVGNFYKSNSNILFLDE